MKRKLVSIARFRATPIELIREIGALGLGQYVSREPIGSRVMVPMQITCDEIAVALREDLRREPV